MCNVLFAHRDERPGTEEDGVIPRWLFPSKADPTEGYKEPDVVVGLYPDVWYSCLQFV